MIPSGLHLFGRKPWRWKMRDPDEPLVDYEQGGIALSDPSEGLFGYSWVVNYDASGGDVLLGREDLPDRDVLFNKPGITRLGLAFDQNMRPVVCFSHPDGAGIRYYSQGAGSYVVLPTPGALYPCIALDERRPEGISESDVILSYTKTDGNLYARVQRESYAERLLWEDVPNLELLGIGMTRELRMQWQSNE